MSNSGLSEWTSARIRTEVYCGANGDKAKYVFIQIHHGKDEFSTHLIWDGDLCPTAEVRAILKAHGYSDTPPFAKLKQ